MELKKSEPIICIDPGTTHSGVVVFDGENVIETWSKFDNYELIVFIRSKCFPNPLHLAIEGISSYGMAVGKTIFETVEWIGRFREAFGFDNTTKIFRKDVKLFLCGSLRAKDTNIRQRVIDIFPATGGGKIPQFGIKKKPGPLYGVTSHSISALAVGLTYKYKIEIIKI